jgi:hypothetical protein
MTGKKKAKKKSSSKADLKAQIKEMESKKRVAAPEKKDKKVSFDSWYHQRKQKIAKCHMKEIIWADFKARGMKDKQTMEEFDKALKLYGVKL